MICWSEHRPERRKVHKGHKELSKHFCFRYRNPHSDHARLYFSATIRHLPAKVLEGSKLPEKEPPVGSRPVMPGPGPRQTKVTKLSGAPYNQ